jgi:hypothetical protein
LITTTRNTSAAPMVATVPTVPASETATTDCRTELPPVLS